ncbi:MAG: SDR family oxidoreductase [Firmicutes bacterium]|nr:SDR family oxidoreductase [Bacillota bacterium]
MASQATGKFPGKRVGTTEEDCAPLIVFIASEDGGYLTGQSFMVDGGIHKHS